MPRDSAAWLSLAATPVFAAMALLTGAGGADAASLICGAAHGGPLGGMAAMYALMSLFHARPWLELAMGQRRA